MRLPWGRAAGLIKRLCQKSLPDVASKSEPCMYKMRTRSEGSFQVVEPDKSGSETAGATVSTDSAVSLVASISNTEPSFADNIIEEEPGDMYMKQLVIIKTGDGRDYRCEDGQIDTCNDAEFMLVGKRLVKELGLKEEPTLGRAELQGINGPILRPTSFVRLHFKMPRLDLDWVDASAYVIDGNVGFNLGNKAISKFGLLGKLHELEQFRKGWVSLEHGGTNSPSASTVNTLMDARSKEAVQQEARNRQERKLLAADIATFREHWQKERPFNAQHGQNTYEPSIGSSRISTTTASTFVDIVGSSHASTWSTSATSISMESSKQEEEK